MSALSEDLGELRRLNAQRFLTLAVGVWGMICAGSIYAFGLWSESFARNVWGEGASENAHIDTQLSTLYQWTLTGVYVPFSGLLYHKFGSKALLAAGAVLMSSGYVIVYLADRRVFGVEYWVLLCFGFFNIGHGAGYVDVAVMGANLKNFKAFRGSAAGFLKGYFGLSASIVAFMYACSELFRDRILLVLGISSAFLIMLGAVLSTELSTREDKEVSQGLLRFAPEAKKILFYAYSVEMFVTLALLLFATIVSITAWTPYGSSGDFLVFMMLTFITFGSFGLWAKSCRSRGDAVLSSDDQEVDESNALKENAEEKGGEVFQAKPVWVTLCSCEFFCLFVALFVGTGAGLTIISNASRICIAKGPDMEANTELFVAVLSVWNCIGRLGTGWVSDQEGLVRVGFSRVRLTVLTACGMILGHSLLFFAESVPLTFLAAALIGMAYGSYWTLFPTLLMDLFGEDNFGIHIAVMQLAPALGSLVFSRLVSTWFYEEHVNSGSSLCFGNQCFGGTHLVIIYCLFVSLGFSVGLARRTEQRTKASL